MTVSFFSDQTKIPCGQKSLIANLRFFFTHRTSNLNYLKKFMDDMETRTLSDIICDNTIIEKVQERSLEIPNPVNNPIRVCARSAGAPKPVSGSGSQAVATGTGDSGPGPLTTVPNIFLETTQSPVPPKIQQQQRVPKSLGPAKFSLNPNFNFESLRPRQSHSSSVFPGPIRPHQSIFDAFRKLQTREFHRIQANSSKPVKFLERFDQSDAIILHP